MIVDRERLKRDCADALEALTKEQRLDGLVELAASLRTSRLRTAFMGR